MIGGDIMRDPLTLGASLPVAPPVQARFVRRPLPPILG